VTAPADRASLHASCVALDGRGLLILGPSGAGKSALALRLMALGARLVADDVTDLSARDGRLVATCPPALRGRIEARGIGLLSADPLSEAGIVLAADLGQAETDRLPPHRRNVWCGIAVDLVHPPRGDHFPAALLCYLRGGRWA
jgi:HPr kinase/phosphorylase